MGASVARASHERLADQTATKTAMGSVWAMVHMYALRNMARFKSRSGSRRSSRSDPRTPERRHLRAPGRRLPVALARGARRARTRSRRLATRRAPRPRFGERVDCFLFRQSFERPTFDADDLGSWLPHSDVSHRHIWLVRGARVAESEAHPARRPRQPGRHRHPAPAPRQKRSRACALREGGTRRPLALMCTPPPLTPLLRPPLTVCLAPCPADRDVFSTIKVILLFSRKDDQRSATGTRWSAIFPVGGEGELGCIRKRAASASGWRCVLACTLYRA